MAYQNKVQNNPYYDEKYIKQAIVPWYKRILLWFLPTYVVIDSGLDEKGYAVFYKSFRGVVYIVGEERLPPVELPKKEIIEKVGK